MEFNEYQRLAAETAIYPKKWGIYYPLVGLSNEAGEALGILKKTMRGDAKLEDVREKLVAELGDVLWYLAMIANDLEEDLGTIAMLNLMKLRDRQLRNKLQGDGDNR